MSHPDVSGFDMTKANKNWINRSIRARTNKERLPPGIRRAGCSLSWISRDKIDFCLCEQFL